MRQVAYLTTVLPNPLVITGLCARGKLDVRVANNCFRQQSNVIQAPLPLEG